VPAALDRFARAHSIGVLSTSNTSSS